MMELADVSDSKSDGSNTVPVRPRLPAPAGDAPARVHAPLLRCVFFIFSTRSRLLRRLTLYDVERCPRLCADFLFLYSLFTKVCLMHTNS